MSPHLAKQIAAGEVIERPASVLKELLENSIDAGSSQIKVEHEEGGIKWLRVSDDGVGVTGEDLPMVFESHATSKLRQIEDLDRLATMGFRGEAMSSISSVSRVSFWSATERSDGGLRAQLHFGKWLGVHPADQRRGTEVIIEDLFDQLPVRKKFLKSAAGEARQLTATWRRYALAYPEIHFSIHDRSSGRSLQAPAMSALERALWFFDASDASHFFESKNEEGIWRIHFIGRRPRFLSPGRAQLLLYLNRRPIRDRRLEMAVRRAFEGFSETPQFAEGVVWIEGSSELFDVNVHPTKSEVRFRDADRIFSAVVHTIRRTLESLHLNSHAALNVQAPPTHLFEPPTFQTMNDEPVMTNLRLFETPFRYLGSFDATYWLVEREGVLFIFDQHALHERVLYENLLATWREQKKLPTQRLLFPIRCHFENAEALLEHEEKLEALGFEIRQWEGQGIQLLAVPAVLKRDHEIILQEILKCQELSDESLLRQVLSTLACHSAIRAHDRVNPAEAYQILHQFQSEDALGHCPHGRPTFIQFESKDFEKLFHRI